MTTDDINELLETVAVHIEWLGRSGTKARQHRVDNAQSADYLTRLVAVVRELGGRIEADQRVVAADPAPTDHVRRARRRSVGVVTPRMIATDTALDMPGPDTTEDGR